MAKLIAINISEKRGTPKREIPCGELIENWGLMGDAHAGSWHRQVSLLSFEKIEDFKARGAEVENGAFGENLIIEGIDLKRLPPGTRLTVGEAVLEVTQIGKECHSHCEIYQRMGECIMPVEGIFAVVIRGGEIRPGDEVHTALPDIYRTLMDKPRGSKAVTAVVTTGPFAGQKALFLDGRIRVKTEGTEDFWDKTAEAEIAPQTDLCGLVHCKDADIFLQPVGEMPRLIICGGGHVSCSLVKMASLLDFEIWVLEDRPFFADRAREAGAHKVICDSFENALRQIPAGDHNYYVCLTRGHRFDEACLLQILPGEFAYAGMMGSKRRSLMLRSSLAEQGIPKEKIDLLHAPIGLDIGSDTPEEIALSIAAQLVQCRSERAASRPADNSILQALAEKTYGERAILCTIIAKQGSTPRGAGTQMLVQEDGTVLGTVGGGCAEAEILTRCRVKLQTEKAGERDAEVMTVEMTTEDAEKEGMVCGGRIKVLLERMEKNNEKV